MILKFLAKIEGKEYCPERSTASQTKTANPYVGGFPQFPLRALLSSLFALLTNGGSSSVPGTLLPRTAALCLDRFSLEICKDSSVTYPALCLMWPAEWFSPITYPIKTGCILPTLLSSSPALLYSIGLFPPCMGIISCVCSSHQKVTSCG